MKNYLTAKLFVIIALLICYSAVNAITIDEVYLVGDAAPYVWNNSVPAPLLQDVANSSIYTWMGALFAGELKISTDSYIETIKVLV